MNTHAKRVLSILLSVLMCVSMLTGIVLPASATTPEPADAYAAINATDIDGALYPADNVYFVDPAIYNLGLTEGEEFEYTYGGTEKGWGNGVTYTLTYGVNTIKNFDWLKSKLTAKNSEWAADPENEPNGIIFVMAPGSQGSSTSAMSMISPVENNPSTADLYNVTFLGPQAGRSPVNPDRSTKEKATAVQNGRTANTTTEYVFLSTFWMPSRANVTVDGVALTQGGKLYGGGDLSNVKLRNVYYESTENVEPSGQACFHFGNDADIRMMVDMDNCYFDFRTAFTTEGSNNVYGNKISVTNCVFTGGTMAKNPGYAQANHMKFYPVKKDNAAAISNFYGEYAAKPSITIANNAVTNWESAKVFRFDLNEPCYSSYTDKAITITFDSNKLYDVGLWNGKDCHAEPIYIDQISTAEQAASHTLHITNNLFSISKEALEAKLANQGGSISFFNANNNTVNPNWYITGNTFIGDPMNGYVPLKSASNQVDISGNLFLDTQNNVIPARVSYMGDWGWGGNWAVQSDLYASDEMHGGIRELFNFYEVKDGIACYDGIQLRETGYTEDGSYFRGAATLLLRDGKEIAGDELITFKDSDVVYHGVFSDLACTEAVETVTNDTVDGLYAKATYTAGNTTATVIWLLVTPKNLRIVDPEGDYTTSGYTFNGTTYYPGETAENGVKADKVTRRDGSEGFYEVFDNAHKNNAGNSLPGAYAGIPDLQTGDYADQRKNTLNTIVVLTPGAYTFFNDGKQGQGMGKNICVVGPQWGVSPFDRALAENGQVANGRGLDTSKEAVVNGQFIIAGDGSTNVVVDGVAFNGLIAPFHTASKSALAGSEFQTITIKNCYFATAQKNGSENIITGWDAISNNKVIDLLFKDNIYVGGQAIGGANHASSQAQIVVRSNFFTAENYAVINDTNEGEHRVFYTSLTDGAAMKWTPKRVYADVNNIVIYNSNRNLILATLRDSQTLNANFNYYPDGYELNLTNNYVTGGKGYFIGIQNGEKTGAEGFIKLNATGNYLCRPDHDQVLYQYQSAEQYNQANPYSEDSVFADNVLITKKSQRYVAGGAALNIDDNFFGYYEGDELKANYIKSSSSGIEKDFTTYYLDVDKTVTNQVAALKDNAFDSFEMVRFWTINEYNVTKETGANVDMFKAVDGATINKIYTLDGEVETVLAAGTALTHPQTIYIEVTGGGYTIVNQVNLTTACDHEGDTPVEEIITPSTCKDFGSKNVKCGWCGEVLEEGVQIDKIAHTPAEEITVVTPSTCETAGVGKKLCTVCGEDAETDIALELAAHTPSEEITVVTPSTCEVAGVGKKVCTVCGEDAETDIALPLAAHTPAEDITVVTPSTCEVAGVGKKVCTVCGEDAETDIVLPLAAHTPAEDITVVTPSTCEVAGVGKKVCTVCGEDAETDIALQVGGPSGLRKTTY